MKTGNDDAILKKQPMGYPFTVTSDYTLEENETAESMKASIFHLAQSPVNLPNLWNSKLEFMVSWSRQAMALNSSSPHRFL